MSANLPNMATVESTPLSVTNLLTNKYFLMAVALLLIAIAVYWFMNKRKKTVKFEEPVADKVSVQETETKEEEKKKE